MREIERQQRASDQPTGYQAGDETVSHGDTEDPPLPHRGQFASPQEFWDAIEQHPIYIEARRQAAEEAATARAEIDASPRFSAPWWEPTTAEPRLIFTLRRDLIARRRLERRRLKAHLGKQEYTQQRRQGTLQRGRLGPHQ